MTMVMPMTTSAEIASRRARYLAIVPHLVPWGL